MRTAIETESFTLTSSSPSVVSVSRTSRTHS